MTPRRVLRRVDGAVGPAGHDGHDGIGILHLSDPQFGAYHRFGEGGHDALAERLLQAIRSEEIGRQLPHIDLVVISGDITETALPAEFRQARAFVDALLDGLHLSVQRLVLVPGNHDVNWKLCAGYCLDQQGLGEEPQPPYAKKWQPYEGFVRDLHGPTAFAADQPYRLQVFDDLGVAVAALNSTMAETHEVHHGWCGERQLQWFADQLDVHPAYLRIAVVHHNVRRKAVADDENLRDEDDLTRILGRHVHLVLHGHTHDGKEDHLGDGTLVLSTGSAALEPGRRPGEGEVPNQCQILHVRPGSVVRSALLYQPGAHRWIGDNSMSAEGGSWQVSLEIDTDLERRRDLSSPPSGWLARQMRSFDFFEAVRSLTRLRDDVRAVESCSLAELDYLRVFGASGEVRAVGVVDGPLTTELLAAFCDKVHRPIQSRGQGARSELVHTGVADLALAQHAGQLGITVKTWTEYQNLLDFRGYAAELRDDLSGSELYPQDLYLPQRYRAIGRDGRSSEAVLDQLADAVVGDMLGDDQRFVLVLGDPGYGKSFLARRVAHLMLDGSSGVTPILVPLRESEKWHSLDALVAPVIQTTVAARSDRFLRMFRDGRVVLLVDGYDEFVVRVGYDRATEQLRTFLEAVTEEGTRAKILLTTRPNHFRSRDEVVARVFENVLELDDHQRRVYALEPFDPTQQRDFLTRWFRRRQDADPEGVAGAWMAALAAVDDLPELAQTPRMLSFMAEDLDLDQLRAAAQAGGPITAAGLYKILIDRWLTVETEHRRAGRPEAGDPWEISRNDRWRVAEELAYRLWVDNEPFVSERLLEDVAEAVLNLPALDLTTPVAAQEIGGRALLVGEGDKRHFAHTSVGEFLLARRLAAVLAASHDPPELGRAKLSELTVRFLRDLAPEATLRWFRAVARSVPDAGEDGKVGDGVDG